jgi:hypothetical protein
MFKEIKEFRKKTSLLYVLNTSDDCIEHYDKDNGDNYDDVNTYLLKYRDTQYCAGEWGVN